METPFWRRVRWLNSPLGRAVRVLVAGLGGASYEVLNSNLRYFIPVVAIVVAFEIISEYLLSAYERRLPTLYIQAIAEVLEYEMMVLTPMLKKTSSEDFQMALLLHYNTDQWIPQVSYNMEQGLGKHRVPFPRERSLWTAPIDHHEPKLEVKLIEPELLNQLDKNDRQAFDDVSAFLIAPIFRAQTEPHPQNLIGAIMIYTSKANSVLQKPDRHENVEDFCSQIGRLLEIPRY